MHESLLSIGELARRAGLRPSALRHYETLGLLKPHTRVGGKRRYLASAQDRLIVIDFAKTLGFSLPEVGVLLKASDGGKSAAQQLRRMAQQKLPDLDRQMNQIALMRKMLMAAQHCRCPSIQQCARAADEMKTKFS